MDQTSAKPVLTETRLTRGHLLRVLGVGFGLAVTVGNTIGAGILRTPGEVAGHLPHLGLFTLVWVAGGVYALLCAVSVAEVATLVPRSGGQYVFAHYAFGDYAGFIVGWSDWLSTCGSMAAVSIIVGEYTGLLFPPLAAHGTRTAMFVVVAFAIVQWRGIRWGSAAQQITALLKTAGFLALIAVCSFATPAAGTSAPPHAPVGLGLLLAIVISLQAVIYTYDGWQGVVYFSEEVQNPARDIPRSMFGGVALVIFIYVTLNLAVLHVLAIGRVAGDPLPLGTAIKQIWGARADTILQVVVIVSMLSAINAYHLMGCRILFALSRDGLFTRLANQVNAGGTPNAGLLMTTAAAIAFVASGTFEKVIAVTAFFFVFNYIVDLLAVVALRRREPGRARPYRAWGYPWTTGLALLASFGFMAGVILGDTRNSVYALLILVTSYPVFRWTRKLARDLRGGDSSA